MRSGPLPEIGHWFDSCTVTVKVVWLFSTSACATTVVSPNTIGSKMTNQFSIFVRLVDFLLMEWFVDRLNVHVFIINYSHSASGMFVDYSCTGVIIR